MKVEVCLLSINQVVRTKLESADPQRAFGIMFEANVEFHNYLRA